MVIIFAHLACGMHSFYENNTLIQKESKTIAVIWRPSYLYSSSFICTPTTGLSALSETTGERKK
jgi:hypothetical protein